MEVLLDLCDTSVRIMRHNLRRRDPQASEEQIEERLDLWLRKRPGAELGDAEGVLVNRFPDLH
jgi:hypothetical protein